MNAVFLTCCLQQTDANRSGVHRLLSQSNWSAESAIDSYYQNGGLPAALPSSSTPQPETMGRDDGGAASVKRSRSSNSSTHDGDVPQWTSPHQQAELGKLSAETRHIMSAVALIGAQLSELSTSMPSAVARQMPAAVHEAEMQREHDRQEVERRKQVQTHGVQIKACSDLLQLGKLAGWRFDTAENLLICENCYRYSFNAPAELKRMNMTCGVIKGPCKKSSFTAVRYLSNVKQDMIVHASSAWHDWCECHAAEQLRVGDKLRQAGLNVGKLVLANVKEHDSDTSFERRITLLQSIGVNVGTKQHSRKFVTSLRGAMHTVLARKIQIALESPMPATLQPPPFAVAADKATVFRRTGQMHAILTMLNGEIIAIFASTVLAGESTGAGLAKLVAEMLTGGKPLTLSAELVRRSMTCLAFDGQYQSEHEGHVCGLAVQQHLTQQMALNGSWLWSRWDGAHLIELAMNSVRQVIGFYSELAGWVSGMQSKYLYGKGYERVRAAAETIHTRLCSVGVVCTTRFCHSERKVYKNFFRNLVVFIKDLEAQRPKPTQVLLKAKSVVQVVQLAGTVDLLRHVKNLSLTLQTVNTLPWENEEVIATQMQLLGTLTTDLEAGKVDRELQVGGMRERAFEFLHQHMAGFKELKLYRFAVGVYKRPSRRCPQALTLCLTHDSILRSGTTRMAPLCSTTATSCCHRRCVPRVAAAAVRRRRTPTLPSSAASPS